MAAHTRPSPNLTEQSASAACGSSSYRVLREACVPTVIWWPKCLPTIHGTLRNEPPSPGRARAGVCGREEG
eukprot:scaffold6068_cov119-Isochrysis_galbana.AAC.8